MEKVSALEETCFLVAGKIPDCPPCNLLDMNECLGGGDSTDKIAGDDTDCCVLVESISQAFGLESLDFLVVGF